MRKLIYYIAASADGCIARSDGSVDGFLMEGPHAEEFMESLARFDTVLMGAETYRFGFRFGLKEGDPAYPGLTHYVFSRSLRFESNQEVRLVASDPAPRVEALKQEEGKNIWLCGGGELAGYLMGRKLIDEIWVKLNPLIIGRGKKLTGEGGGPADLELLSSKEYGNGVLLLKYRVM